MKAPETIDAQPYKAFYADSVPGREPRVMRGCEARHHWPQRFQRAHGEMMHGLGIGEEEKRADEFFVEIHG